MGTVSLLARQPLTQRGIAVTEEVYQRVDLLDETVFRLLTTLACRP